MNKYLLRCCDALDQPVTAYAVRGSSVSSALMKWRFWLKKKYPDSYKPLFGQLTKIEKINFWYAAAGRRSQRLEGIVFLK